ncbi:MAG: bifunctional 3-deoxy-7-phosphoheptulonate synthase/chorismate mutase type II [Chitinophagaceae bacterium]
MSLFTSKKPFIIAGPCGAESEEQLQTLLQAFKSLPIDMFRAGVWKPRSKPGHFEGRGEAALAWLSNVQTELGKPVCIEVADKEHVALALHYGIKAVWIGARTTVNPFLVQEIVDALKGSDTLLMIKNPVNPDVELWAGAVERAMQAGIQDIAAIHRGFSVYDPSSLYRNKPLWTLPIELKRRYPNLPIIVDPSHIAGKRTLVAEVCQRALDLDFDGLMIETHPNPDDALSDAAQQITPDTLKQLLDDLMVRCNERKNLNELEQVRTVLDSLDAELVSLLGRRMDLARDLALLKNEHNMPVFQLERWREIIDSRTAWGYSHQLESDFIHRLFELIHDTSIKIQLDRLKNLEGE